MNRRTTRGLRAPLTAMAAATAIACSLMTAPAASADDASASTSTTSTTTTAASTISRQAKWIGRTTPEVQPALGEQNPAPLIRRSFTLGKTKVKRARLTIVGLGYYEAAINGRPVSDAVLDPPPSQYDKTAYSRTIDVTRLLRTGKNAIGVTLGRSFLSTPTTAKDQFNLAKAPWRSEPRLRAQLDVTLANGKKVRLVTDKSWKIADGPARDALYYGEYYDARQEKRGWTRASYDDRSWERALEQPAPTKKVIATTAPPVRVKRTYAPKKVTRPQAGTKVYDFATQTAGWARIAVKGSRGTTVKLVYGQQLEADGTVHQQGVTGSAEPSHVDTYTLKGSGKETWEPSFTRHGFRYVEVTTSGGSLSSFSIRARENHTDLETTGRFSSSNPLINKLHKNQQRSLLLNHWGFPTDTAWRDRLGWTADAALYIDDAAYNFDVKSLYKTWMRTFRDTQKPDGSLSVVAPDPGAFPTVFDNDPSWSGTIVLDAWSLYQHYGDRTFLTQNYRAMTRWMNLMESKISATGNLYTGWSFGDWSSPGSQANNNGFLVPPEGTDASKNAHLFHEAKTLAAISTKLGRTRDAARYSAMAARIRTAFNAAYFDTATKTYRTPKQVGYRQTPNLMALGWGIVPKADRAAVFSNLVKDLTARGYNLNTGAIGTKLLLPVLTENGRGDLAYKVLTQTDYPSWGYWTTQGADTSWEVWSLGGIDQALDHAFLGTFDSWLYSGLAGISPAAPGYAKLQVAPVIPAGLKRASGTVSTPNGTARSSWRKSGKRIVLTVTTPKGVPTRVRLPKSLGTARVTDGPGRRVTGVGAPSERVFSLTGGRTTITVTR